TIKRVGGNMIHSRASVLAIAWLAAGAAHAQSITAIKAGHLVDVTAGKVLSDQVIVIADERIRAVGPAGSVRVPDGAKVVALSDSTVLPGLVDTHTHLTSDPTQPPYHGFGKSLPRIALEGAANARATLLAGVTTVRDVGATGFTGVALRDAINEGDVPGPRMFVSGPALGITGGHCDANLLAPEFKYESDGVFNGADGVRVGVRRNVKYGADLIKYCGTGGVFSKGDTLGWQRY